MDQARDKGEMTPQFGRVLTDHFTQNADGQFLVYRAEVCRKDMPPPSPTKSRN